MQHSRTGRPGIVIAVAAALALGACARGDMRGDDTLGLTTTAAGEVGTFGDRRTPAATFSLLAAADQAEVDAGQLAQERATNARVREFAQTMVTEHSASMRNAGEVARGMEVEPRRAGDHADDALIRERREVLEELRNTPRGARFDSLYIASQVRMHEDLLQRLEGIAEPGDPGRAGPDTPTSTPTGTTGRTSSRSGGSGTTGSTGQTVTGTGEMGGAQATGGSPGEVAGRPQTAVTPAHRGVTQTPGASVSDYGRSSPQEIGIEEYLRDTTDMIRRHLEQAREIQRQLGGGA